MKFSSRKAINRRKRSTQCVALLFALLSSFSAVHATTLENWVATAVRFTQWPTDSSAGRWTVCQPVGERALQMDAISVRGRRFSVVTVVSPSETGPCDVFVFASAASAGLEPWITSLRSRPVLTLGVGQNFCNAGGALCVARDSTGRNAFVVNTAAYTGAGMRMSGHLPVHSTHAAPANLAQVN